MDFFSSFSKVFSKTKYLLLFAGLLALLTLLYFSLTNVFLLGTLTLNPSLKVFDASLIFLISALSSLGFTLFAYQFLELKAFAASKTACGASALGFFVSACPVCQPICLVWLGLGSVSLVLIDYSIYIALASVLLLAYANYISLCSISRNGGCKIQKKHTKLN